MPVQVSFPGVYVQEIPSGVRTITGVSTSIAIFMGMISRGPLNQPVRILSFADFERTFGTDTSSGEMTDQVRQFFVNGGRQAFVMRIADGALAARVDLKDQFTNTDTVLSLEARSAGAIGETVRAEVDYATSDPESTFNIRVLRLQADTSGILQEVESETFSNLSMNPDAATYVVDTLNLQSKLVKALPGTPPTAVRGFSIAGVLMSGVTQLNNIITSVDPLLHKGRFQISVDGAAFVSAEIGEPSDATQPSIDAAITDPVNTALAPTGKTVSVSILPLGGLNSLRIESAKVGGSVRIVPAVSNDIAIPMQMGAQQGGLEVDGFAPQRPAPTGVFSILGVGGGGLAALDALLATDPASVTSITITDTSVSSPNIVNLPSWPAPGGTQFSRGSLLGDRSDSLLNLSENLQNLVTQISNSPIPWSAKLTGLRVSLVPDFGGSDSDTSATVTTAGAANLGAAGQIFANRANVKQYRLGAFTNTKGAYQFGAKTGSDGAFPKLQQYRDAFPIIDRGIDLFNLLILPRANGQTDIGRKEIWGPASSFCLDRRAFLLVDPLVTWLDVSTVKNDIVQIRTGLVKDHAAVYWPRVTVSTNGSTKVIDPSGSIAGLMARTDSNRGVWKAPAGIEADIRGIRGVEHTMSDPENGIINPEAVNALRVFATGIVSWGARTVDGFDNSGNDDYKYVPVRRLALFIEESLYRGLKFAVFEPNDEPLWGQIRVAAGAFMNNLFRQGAFQGQKASDAYFVKVDAETTTQNDINLGIVNVVVGFAPLKPAEFVIITLQQKAGQVQT